MDFVNWYWGSDPQALPSLVRCIMHDAQCWVRGLVRDVAAAVIEGSNTIWIRLPEPCKLIQPIVEGYVDASHFPTSAAAGIRGGSQLFRLAIFHFRTLAVLLPMKLC